MVSGSQILFWHHKNICVDKLSVCYTLIVNGGVDMRKGERFNREIERIVRKHGGQEDSTCSIENHWTIMTLYGLLFVSVHRAEPRQKLFSVFTRFADPKLAVPYCPGVNRFSGKWNFHLEDADEMIRKFDHTLAIIKET